ncbi:hypothetical protein ES703_112376 [subsurface metagenome]
MKKNKILIVYGTRYGATTGTAEEIAKVLQDGELDVKVVNLKKEKVRDIAEYELIVIGSGMQIDRWTRKAVGFLKRFSRELENKKVALFVSSGAQALTEHDGNPEEIGRARKKYLEEKASKYNLNPISMGLFGGIWDYNNMPFWAKKFMGPLKIKIKAAGIKETKPGVYDTRNWDAIQNWAKELAKKLANPPIVNGEMSKIAECN